MADKYVRIGDPVNGGGTSWGDAYNSFAGLQTAIDEMAAGETCHLSVVDNDEIDLEGGAALDIDAAGGVWTGRIHLVGYNDNSDSPVEDGTRVVFNAGDGTPINHCVLIDDRDHWELRNLTFTNGANTNIEISNVDNVSNWMFINCVSDNGGDVGFGSSSISAKVIIAASFIGCLAINNSSGGFVPYASSSSSAQLCLSINNGGYGFYYLSCFDCVAANNSGTGFYRNGHVRHCSAYTNTGDGIDAYSIAYGAFAFNRCIDNTGDGIDAAREIVALWCHLQGNGGVAKDPMVKDLWRGTATTSESTDDPFENADSDLFATRFGAPLYRNNILLADDLTRVFACAGLPASHLPRIGAG